MYQQQETQLKASVQRLSYRFILYIYWVSFVFFTLGSFLLTFALSYDIGRALFVLTIVGLFFGLLAYPMKLAKELVPDLLALLKLWRTPYPKDEAPYRFSDPQPIADPNSMTIYDDPGDRYYAGLRPQIQS
jgi:hypothetical protein